MDAIQGLLALKERALEAARLVAQKPRPVSNADLRIELDELVATHETAWNWTKGTPPTTTTTGATGRPSMERARNAVRGRIVARTGNWLTGWDLKDSGFSDFEESSRNG